jgi:hypothetical protein
MSLDASDAVRQLSSFLQERGYTMAIPAPTPPARWLAVKRGHSLGILLPFTDYIVAYELDEDAAHDPIAFEKLHAVGIEYADFQAKMPRILRYRVPNVVTVGVSDYAPSPALMDAVTKIRLRSQLAGGGLKESTYIFDIAAGRFHGTAIEETPGRYGATTTTSVNPTNRVRRMMDEFAAQLFGGV